ncbi:hypothetical protein MLD38_040865 [Melastoma candidum]|nr:hypothetical protein MLD38_040865 [Melastoma candidum]
MKKAFDQTVRELKREVNKKVLKVPTIEQKVLDATSNEPWGPHGTLLADIAHASKNHYEYQMILTVIWKRMNDTGKNWRHVYKALTVLEYLVANGSERVIDEIREHAYQISTLSSFQYIDSKGRDQGNNVRRKSQSLVILVNDNDRVAEVRQKAAANREKFRSISSTGGMYRPRSYSDFEGYGGKHDEDRYGSRDYDRDGHGGRNGREWSRDDDRYRYGDSYSYSGERYGRDYEDRFGRDAYRDDGYQGRSRSIDGSQHESRGKSLQRESDPGMDDDVRRSSQGLERKFSEQNLSMPPRYEEAVSESRSPDQGAKEVEKAATPAPKSLPPPPGINNTGAAKNVSSSPLSPQMPVVKTADDFDPRGPHSGQPTSSKTTDTELLGSFVDPSSDNSLALVPVTPLTAEAEFDSLDFSGSASRFSASASSSVGSKQPYEDPFGDSPFKANGVAPPVTQQTVQAPLTAGGTFSGFSSQQLPMHQYSAPDPNTDILAGILALPAPSPATTPEVISTPCINPYGTVAAGPMGAPTSIPTVSNQYYGYGGMPPHIHGQGTMVPQMGQGTSMSPQLPAPQAPRDNFQPKSTIWADTLSRGLVDLNISGSKTNPLADIGVDFDALNRKEKRLEKAPPTTAAVSNVVMGKAMGSGSGVGRAGANSMKPPPGPMVGGSATGWGGYGGMGMNMNMGMGQGMAIQQSNVPPGPTPMAGGYNPMRGPSGYTQQSYGGIYR